MAKIFIGIILELLLAFKRLAEKENEVARFRWIPIPAAVGFALILTPSLNIGLVIGS